MKFQEGPSISRLVRASLTSQISAFLFFFAAEMILFFWLGNHIRLKRVSSFLLTYLLSGAVLGAGIATATCLSLKIKKALIPSSLLLAMDVAGFQLFAGLLILNGSFLPDQPIFSVSGFLSSSLLFCFSLAIFFILYAVDKARDGDRSVWRSVNACSSAGLIFGISHALVSRAAGAGGLSFFHGIEYTLLFMFIATAFVLLTGRSGALAKKLFHLKSSRGILITKAAIVAAILVIVFVANRYEPLVTSNRPEQSAATGPHKPNIIILVLDTVRQDQLSTYGCARETTPNLTEFAKAASVLDGYSTMSWTLASHASMVTGKYPTETGTGTAASYHIDLRNETLAEILRENGYSTAAVIANCGVLSGESGFQQGFDYYSAMPRETTPPFRILATSLLEKLMRNSPVNNILFYRRAEKINREALGWIQGNGNRPFFLFINYMDAHNPYVPPPPFNHKWYKGEPPPNLGAGLWLADLQKKIDAGKGGYEQECQYLLSQYDGAIAYVDEQIGMFLEQLKQKGLFDDSLIIITADHGECFAEHSIMQHPAVLYQQVLHVPLFVKPPAAEAPASFQQKQPVSLIEIFRLVLHYAHVPQGEKTVSEDLLENASSPVFSEGHLSKRNKLSATLGTDMYSIVKNNYKLISSSNGTYSFFNLSDDQSETHNLLEGSLHPQEEQLMLELKAELASHIKTISAASFVARDLPPETREKIRGQLKALGYLQ